MKLIQTRVGGRGVFCHPNSKTVKYEHSLGALKGWAATLACFVLVFDNTKLCWTNVSAKMFQHEHNHIESWWHPALVTVSIRCNNILVLLVVVCFAQSLLCQACWSLVSIQTYETFCKSFFTKKKKSKIPDPIPGSLQGSSRSPGTILKSWRCTSESYSRLLSDSPRKTASLGSGTPISQKRFFSPSDPSNLLIE